MLPSKALAARDANKSSKDNLFFFAAAFVWQDCKKKKKGENQEVIDLL